MRIYAPPVSTIAAAVWASATRSLTVDPTPFTSSGANAVAIGAGVTAVLGPGAGHWRTMTVGPLANAQVQGGSWDGSTFSPIDTSAGANLCCSYGSTVAMAVKNVSAGGLTYTYLYTDRGP